MNMFDNQTNHSSIVSSFIFPLFFMFFCSLIFAVSNGAAQTVKLYPSTIRVEKGKSKTVTAVAYDAANAVITNAAFSFTNSSPGVASLTSVRVPGSGGLGTVGTAPPNLRSVVGVAAGTTTITATRNGLTSNVGTIVVDDPATAPTAIMHGDNDAGGGSTITTKVGEPIEVDADSSQGVSQTEWTWGDGDKTTDLLSATHAYLTAGTYSLVLKVTNSGGSIATKTVTVTVQAQTACTASNTITVTSIIALQTQYESLPLAGGKCLLMAPGVYVGELVLIARNFTDYVTIGSNAAMPNIADRISPTNTGLVTIRSSSAQTSVTPVIIKNGATKLRLMGMKFDPAYAAPDASDVNSNYYAIQVGEVFAQTSASQNPSKIIFQHCVINPHDDVKIPHGFLNDGYKVAVISSWFGNVKTYGAQDSQAVCSFSGRGAHVYNNDYLEGASENVLYGGADPKIDGLVGTNLEFRRCYFPKRLSWRVYTNNNQSHPINEKNLFETKNARRLYIEGSIFENHWDAYRSQLFALVFKSSSYDAPWSVSEEIVLENNKINHIYGGFTFSIDTPAPFIGLKPNNIKLKNNLIDDLSNRWGCPLPECGNGGKFLQPNSVEDLQVSHVTVIDKDQTAGTGVFFVTNNNFRFRVENSIFGLNGYGIIGDGVGVGFRALNPGTGGTLTTCVKDTAAAWNLSKNVMPFYGGDTSCYPAAAPDLNYYPLNYGSVGFTDLTNSDYRLSASSAYKNLATDGTDPGADITLLNQRTACTVSGLGTGCSGGSPSSPTPYPGPNRPNIPATIEAENFDRGGEGVAYHEVSGATGSGAYRSSPIETVDVQARTAASNGYTVFEASAGEWLGYSINTPSAGTYDLGVAYSSEFNNGKFHVEIDGVNVTGTMTANSTGNWGTFQTLTKTGVAVSAGTHFVKLVMDTNSPDSCACVVANFDKIVFQTGTAPVSRAVVFGGTNYTSVTLPNAAPFTALGGFQIIWRIRDATMPASGLPGMLFEMTSGLVVPGDYAAADPGNPSRIDVGLNLRSGDTHDGGLYMIPTNYYDAVCKLQFDPANSRWTYESWKADGTGYVSKTLTVQNVSNYNLGGTGINIGSNLSNNRKILGKLDYWRWIQRVEPLGVFPAATAPTGVTYLLDYEFENNLSDSSGRNLNLSPQGTPTYANTP